MPGENGGATHDCQHQRVVRSVRLRHSGGDAMHGGLHLIRRANLLGFVENSQRFVAGH
jgi:hypothetical protein